MNKEYKVNKKMHQNNKKQENYILDKSIDKASNHLLSNIMDYMRY